MDLFFSFDSSISFDFLSPNSVIEVNISQINPNYNSSSTIHTDKYPLYQILIVQMTPQWTNPKTYLSTQWHVSVFISLSLQEWWMLAHNFWVFALTPQCFHSSVKLSVLKFGLQVLRSFIHTVILLPHNAFSYHLAASEVQSWMIFPMCWIQGSVSQFYIFLQIKEWR